MQTDLSNSWYSGCKGEIVNAVSGIMLPLTLKQVANIIIVSRGLVAIWALLNHLTIMLWWLLLF